jgi:hypothetical protein
MKQVSFFVCALALIYSCKKDPVPGPAGPAGTNGINGNPDKGTISGTVKQYNKFGKPYFTNLNTTTVSIPGTDITTITDTAGNYILTNVKAGVYDLHFTRNGSRLHKATQVNFPGNGNLSINTQICDTATFNILAAVVRDSVAQTVPYIYLSTTAIAEDFDRSVMLFFGSTAAVSAHDPATFRMSLVAYLMKNNSEISVLIPYQNTYLSDRFQSGQKIYVKVYPAVYPQYGQYYDTKTDQTVFTMLGSPYPATFLLTMP